jgi:hypothetical protein
MPNAGEDVCALQIARGLVLLLTSVLVAGCASHAAGAHKVIVTKSATDLSGCVVLGRVAGQAPYDGQNDAIDQMRDQTIGLGGNVLLVTSELFTKTGVAYRCGK